MRRQPTIIAFVAVLLGACADQPAVTAHPSLRGGPDAPEIGSRSLASVSVTDVLDRIENRSVRGRLGSLAGDPAYVLARPIVARELPNRDVLVLDAMMSELRALAIDGSRGRVLLRRGRGPLEITSVHSLDVLPPSQSSAGRVVVGTRLGIKTFVLEGDSLSLTQELRPPEVPVPQAVCADPGGFYIRTQRLDDDGIVTRVDGTGRAMARMGLSYWHGSPLVRDELSVGPIACDGRGGVVVAYTYLPYLFAFDSSGGERWRVRIPQFETLAFEEGATEGGASTLRMRFDVGGDMVQAVHVLDSAVVAVQVARLAPSTPDRPNVQEITALKTFLIDVQSGVGREVPNRLPHLLGSGARSLWAVEEGDAGHPVIVGYSLRER